AQFDRPPDSERLPLKQIERAGLINRANVRRIVVEYAAADARVRLEMARRYPDIHLGPSYAFQEGFPAYLLSGGLSFLPVFARNEGPIAEAEAARAQAGARLMAAQAQALGEIESSLGNYRSAITEWHSAQSVTAVELHRQAEVHAALTAGSADRLTLTSAQLSTIIAERAQLDALANAQVALGTLEDSVGQPLDGGALLSDPPERTARRDAGR
ncbi:MAG: TolC family protein, partial [Bryobacteraceae bacterium]